MKKKRIGIIVLAIILLWLAAGVTDFALVHSYHRPLFCVCTEPMQDGGSGKYVGLGYSFDIEGNFVTEAEYRGVTSYRGYILGKEVSRGFWEIMLPGDGMNKFQPLRTEHLMLQTQCTGNFLRNFCTILGVSQDGPAHISAVYPQLMGPAGNGRKFQFA